MHTHLINRLARPRACFHLTLLLALTAVSPRSASADTLPPRAHPEATLEEHLKTQVPGELLFEDTKGNARDFYEFADSRAPTLLVLASARCHAPCSNVLPQVGAAVSHLDLEPGRDFRLLTISLDPKEARKDSIALQRASLASIGYQELWRWPHLHGHAEELARLTAVLGVGYVWDEDSGQYLYPPVAVVLGPDGRIARYLQGADLVPSVLSQALRAASAGGVQATAHAAVEANSNSKFMRYVLLAGPYLQTLAIAVALGMGLTWLMARLRRKRMGLERPSAP